MNSSVGLVGESPGVRCAFTEAGSELIGVREDISDLALRFCSTPLVNETFLRGNLHIGVGKNSEVWEVNGVAMKLSTVDTGKLAWEYSTSIAPENLIGQLEYLTALGYYLSNHTDGVITVPEQYFAIRNRGGDFLKAEEYMAGWISLHSLTRSRGYTEDEAVTVNRTVRRRLLDSVTDGMLRRGLSDLGITGNESLYDQNVLVPEDTDNPAMAPLCIIDQPNKGIIGRIIARAVKLQTKLS